jgi:hypothetical protein
MSDRKKLEKLLIRSFANRDFTGEDTSRKFSTPINPESFTKNFKVNVDTQNGHGSPGSEVRYKSTAPEELRLEFILDGTKSMENYGGMTVLSETSRLKNNWVNFSNVCMMWIAIYTGPGS